jgi:hypothetical protein
LQIVFRTRSGPAADERAGERGRREEAARGTTPIVGIGPVAPQAMIRPLARRKVFILTSRRSELRNEPGRVSLRNVPVAARVSSASDRPSQHGQLWAVW